MFSGQLMKCAQTKAGTKARNLLIDYISPTFKWWSDPRVCPPSPPRSQPQSRFGLRLAPSRPTNLASTAHALSEPSLTPLRAGQYTSFLKLSGIGHDAAIAGLRGVHGG